MSAIELAVIGGSGLYHMAELTEIETVELDTPFGNPSDVVTVGTLHGRRVAFLPRHGRGHTLTPSEVPYRANIFALKTLGVKYIISVSACGSLREDFAPGEIVVPDQLFDFTKGQRDRSFFGRGIVAHLAAAHPFSGEMSAALAQATAAAGGVVHRGGAFITVEGPRFSTRAESDLFRQWGMSIIGMTTSPEAFLAAEAEIAYACMAHVTDYDCWHESEAHVTTELVVRTLMANTATAQAAISRLVADFDQWAGEFAAHSALRDALITHRDRVVPSRLAELEPIIGKYFD
ncbi:S-methyl-5'-thioadenosine phosphorylase [Candidatus Promineifilum breve]|uniref:Purine nucleoside phosphorylase n=1 Tax=Candidatus Promineifilum breve TaxID=1806508 RepID=A0A160SYD0_9CHLR|nr:S-methyl-5'-thioadenosine phosphorylase [Candidatus Promineifilum breve]CUS01942.1 S-methyl-5'-thioadenosine phosphorylase [Candidatus Promineifilum breve]